MGFLSGENFFIGVGTTRSGTTWIYECLKEHPEILPSEDKELQFFNRDYNFNKGLDWYMAQIDCGGGICGEYTPAYIYSEKAIRRIAKYFPNAKLIVSLRDPVYRAYSEFDSKNLKATLSNLTFEQALKENPEHIKRGKYYNHLTNLFKHFPKEQVHIIIFDDISKRPEKVLKDLYGFLGVGRNFKPSVVDKKVNKAIKNKGRFVANFLFIPKLLRRLKLIKIIDITKEMGIYQKILDFYTKINVQEIDKKPLDSKLEEKLRKRFVKDIEKLEKLINVDLSNWKML